MTSVRTTGRRCCTPGGLGSIWGVPAPVHQGAAGRCEYASLRDFVERHPTFLAFRREQKKITDRSRPCLLIDHPEVFRRIWAASACRAAKNMTDGYVDGEIARHIDDVAKAWAETAERLPPLPAEREQQVEATAAAAT
jgi:hypothetical protein